MFPNPDFELYDNPGRTTEQINAAHTGAPTRDDLRRWSVKEGSVPEPVGPAITAWTDRLHDAKPSEAAQLILLTASDPNGVLPRLHEFLEAAADKLQQAGAGKAAAEVTGIVGRLLELDADLYYVSEGAWDDVNAAQRRHQQLPRRQCPVHHRRTIAGTPARRGPGSAPPGQPVQPLNRRSGGTAVPRNRRRWTGRTS